MNKIYDWIYLVCGALLSALALDWFLVPNKIASGGASGVGTILYNSLNIPVSVTILIINGILFAIGYRTLGRHAIIRTVAATVLMSVFTQMFSYLRPLSSDMLINSIFGGALMGVGSGLTIASGASTGGTDLAAILLNGAFGGFSIANYLLVIDLVIAIASGVIFKDYSIMLYALVALFVGSRFVDKIINGSGGSRLVYVISSRSKEIAHTVLNSLDMGLTSLNGMGMYKENNMDILMCAMRRNDFPRFRKAVLNIDNQAFIILTEASEVFGEGFNK